MRHHQFKARFSFLLSRTQGTGLLLGKIQADGWERYGGSVVHFVGGVVKSENDNLHELVFETFEKDVSRIWMLNSLFENTKC